MASNSMGKTNALFKRLPKENPNITELTAIARIKPGMYPKERLKIELAGKMPWLAPPYAPKDLSKVSWLDHLRAVLDWAHENRQEAIKKMVTIHYARWVIVDTDNLPGIDGPHVIFTSNFDGELYEYLEDFTAVDEGPLNLIFGHCIGWPGARPTEGFVRYVYAHRYPAGVFYANYPMETVEEVNRALDWKQKTDHFIRVVVPKLRRKRGAVWENAMSKYLNDLAKPTPKNRS